MSSFHETFLLLKHIFIYDMLNFLLLKHNIFIYDLCWIWSNTCLKSNMWYSGTAPNWRKKHERVKYQDSKKCSFPLCTMIITNTEYFCSSSSFQKRFQGPPSTSRTALCLESDSHGEFLSLKCICVFSVGSIKGAFSVSTVCQFVYVFVKSVTVHVSCSSRNDVILKHHWILEKLTQNMKICFLKGDNGDSVGHCWLWYFFLYHSQEFKHPQNISHYFAINHWPLHPHYRPASEIRENIPRKNQPRFCNCPWLPPTRVS